MKILVVGLNYAPEVTGIAVYTTGIAEGLAALGHEVRVLTGLPHYPQWRVADDYRSVRSSCEAIQGVTVRRSRHYVPASPGPRTRIRMEASFTRTVVTQHWDRADVVISVSPSLLATAGVVAKARARNIPVGVVVQDLYGKGVVETGALSGRAADATAWLEASTLRAATAVSVIHDRFAASLVDMGVDSSSITVIRNWANDSAAGKAPGDTALFRRSRSWARDDVIVLHAGNIGVKQGLDNVVDAAKRAVADGRAERQNVRFVLVGDGNCRKPLEEAAAGVANIEFIDPLPEDEFHTLVQSADILLLNEKPGVGDMSVPSKLTTYFLAGKPVLGATGHDGVAAQEIRAAGAGLIVSPGDSRALLDGVYRLARNEAMAKKFGCAGRRYATIILDRSAAIERYERWCIGLARHSLELAS